MVAPPAAAAAAANGAERWVGAAAGCDAGGGGGACGVADDGGAAGGGGGGADVEWKAWKAAAADAGWKGDDAAASPKASEFLEKKTDQSQSSVFSIVLTNLHFSSNQRVQFNGQSKTCFSTPVNWFWQKSRSRHDCKFNQ